MSLLTPDFGLLFWMLVSFAIVFGILAKVGFPIITAKVDRRRDHIQKSLEAADEANRKLDSVREEAARIMEETKQQSTEIIKNAIAEGEKAIENATLKAHQESEKLLEAARQRIEVQKEKALSDISSQVAMMSLDIAEKILERQLTDRDSQEALITQMIDEAEQIKRKRTHNKN